MTKQRFKLANPNNSFKDMGIGIIEDNHIFTLVEVVNKLNNLAEENEQLKQWNDVYKDERDYYAIRIIEVEKENEQLKQYKQSVNDVLKSWSQKNLTAKQLQVVLAIMEELNVLGDVE